MSLPFYELDVLSRAIDFKNLSAASQQVGLSQPQLSRIIAKLEEEFHVQLLDRTSKRHASWTTAALELAKSYNAASRRLQDDIVRTTQEVEPKVIKLGSLEGLAGIASDYCERLLKSPSLQVVHLDVYDVIDLEKYFLEGGLDIILTQRVPGRKKYKFSKLLGHQILKIEGKPSEIEILSEYQLFSQKEKKDSTSHRKFISNSLMVRKLWIEKGLGQGRIPSEVYKNISKNIKFDEKPEEVLLIANDNFSGKLWKLF